MSLRPTTEPEVGVKVPGSGVAVGASGHLVYIADTENHRVDEFEADGTFLRAWGWGVGGGIGFETCSALCQTGASGSEPGELASPVFIAVDNSAAPSAGDVYVGDTADNVITKFTAAGALETAWATNGQLAGTGSESFGALAGVTVDATGHLNVINAAGSGESHMFTFNQDGSPSANVIVPRGTYPAGLAPSGSEAFFKANGDQTIEKFVSSGADIGEVKAETAPNLGELVTSGIATDSTSGDLYVNSSGVHIVASGGGVERYAFTSAGEVIEPGGGSCPVQPNVGCAPTESFGAANLTAGGGAGVGVDSSTATVYAADASADRVAAFRLQPLAAPLVVSESVSDASDSNATLRADLNPRTVSGEAATTYHFEYGPCPEGPSRCPETYSDSTPSGSISAGYQPQEVTAPIAGLHGTTIYHYRIVAVNGHGETLGPQHTFTTLGGGEFRLIDGRQWEMASPPQLHGALLLPLGVGGVTQAAAAGGSIAYVANVPTEEDPAGYTFVSVAVMSQRGAGSWSAHEIAVPHAVPTGLGGTEVPLYSESLSQAVVQPLGSFMPLAESASEQTAYLRDNATGSYTPLVTACPAAPASCPPAVEEHADVLPGTVFGQISENGQCPPATIDCGPLFLSASPDLKHLILSSLAPLVPGANEHALYEWNASLPASQQLKLVSLLPGGKELPAPQPELGNLPGGIAPQQRRAVSADGSRVFFTANSHLYMRDVSAGKTVQLDVPEPGCGECGNTGFQQPEFQLASKEGSRIFFVDTQKLTSDAKAYGSGRTGTANQGGDLYFCELHEDTCAPKDLTPSDAMMGELLGASEDGTTIYFAADNDLKSGNAGSCTNGQPGDPFDADASCGLYVDRLQGNAWHRHLIASLSGADTLDWSIFVEAMTARASADGNWLAFMSQRPLTGYDNRDAVSGQPDQEVFLYEAAHERLTCASCDPSGARPHGVEFGSGNTNVPELRTASWSPNTWLAGSLPSWESSVKTKDAMYQPRYLSDSGRLLFDSQDALVPKDVNGTGDVYEFEPEGVPAGAHACADASGGGAAVFKPARTFEVQGQAEEEASGCVGLLSAGSSSEESALLDASETGGDVFFISSARLSPLDTEGGVTLYDAHECTDSSPCIPAPGLPLRPCATEASCKAAPSEQPSIFGPSGSATFSGAGNAAPQTSHRPVVAQERTRKLKRALKACRRIRSHARRQRCERAAGRRYGLHASMRRAGAGRGVRR